MGERIRYVIAEMRATAEDVGDSFGSLSESHLNWKPSEKSWSIGQCLDHIIKTNHEFDPEFRKLASGNRKNSFWEDWSPFTGMGGRFLVNAVKTDSKKAKAPSKAIVPPSNIEADIVNRFAEHVADVNRKVEACSGVDLQKTVVTSPFLSVFTYKFDDALTVLVEHSKRHVRQAKRVVEAEGFPK
jgi:hypothetical protein